MTLSAFELIVFLATIPVVGIHFYCFYKGSNWLKQNAERRVLCGVTAAEAARTMLDAAGLADVTVTLSEKVGPEKYKSDRKVLALCREVAESASVSAIAATAREAGRALQYKDGYAGARLCAVFSKASFVLLNAYIVPLAFGFYMIISNEPRQALPYIAGAIALIEAVVLLALCLYPFEKDASARAFVVLEQTGLLTPAEMEAARDVLKAGAFTGIAGVSSAAYHTWRKMLSAG